MANRHEPLTAGYDQARAALARDQALVRVGRTRRLMIAGAAALTAALAALASVLLPGKSLAAKSHTAVSAGAKVATAPGAAPQLPAPANAAQLGLQSSGQAPQAAPASQAAAPQPAPQQAAPQPAPQPVAPQPAPAVVSGGS